MRKVSLKLLFAALLMTGALAVSGPSKAFGSCGHGLSCPDVYSPVICSNGVVYSNACYASLACATGCVPYGVAAAE